MNEWNFDETLVWLGEISYFAGRSDGIKSAGKVDTWTHADGKGLSLHWTRGMGLSVHVVVDGFTVSYNNIRPLVAHRMDNRNYDLDYFRFINRMVAAMFPRMKIFNTFDVCTFCLETTFVRAHAGALLCTDCINRFSLVEENDTTEYTPKEPNYQKEERAKMTPSVRYRILRRDAFTCQLCGHRADPINGITLHVDHKVPISKGGKTVDDNLWTLCQLCNSGKGVNDLPQQLDPS